MGKTDKTSSHRYGNGGLGTRMCVLVAPEDYEHKRGLRGEKCEKIKECEMFWVCFVK